MPVELARTNYDKANCLCGIFMLSILLVVGIVLMVLAAIEKIPDLYVIGGIFLFFDIAGFTVMLVVLLRPVYRLRQIETDTQVPESQINEAIRRSKLSLNSQNTTDMLHSTSFSAASLQGSDVLIDVKSRMGSATGEKKGVSFYLKGLNEK
ncbi:hypothetical protein KP79_PYT05893 [Mizuhopecten yessoensis]|uniref:Uncharacterized protein n=1 Tax=Mizuhopecten yessoensis TaxID=6573 RepID=A0A210QIH8_MIZYE|nr:hypothetical protein KP79_PYT05893 [Mizuhopecten yessoensis]